MPVLVWRKYFSHQLDQVLLQEFSKKDPTRLIISTNPPKPGIQVEVYPKNKAEGLHLIKRFGGRLITLTPKVWWLPQEPRSEPLRIGNRLLVVSTLAQKRYWSEKYPSRKLLIIPANLAFGTGEHATTEMCLKQIAKIKDWPSKTLLDIGTGSGILAIAARGLGAKCVEAFDNDRRSIAVARENEKNNFEAIDKFQNNPVLWKVFDVKKLSSKSAYNVIAANLYSELLLNYSHQIVRALKPGGELLLSGIFEDQLEAVKNVFLKQKLHITMQKQKRRWWCVHFVN